MGMILVIGMMVMLPLIKRNGGGCDVTFTLKMMISSLTSKNNLVHNK